jgi:glycosyltransferase involved in cell wall biosynthesis
MPILFISAFTSRIFSGRKGKPRLVWGEAPIINNVYWSNCMKEVGFKTETFTDSFCYRINERNEYDRVIQDEFRFIPLYLKYYFGFLDSLFKYDIYFISFNGFFLWRTICGRFESTLLKIAAKKIVIIPFGCDSYAYNRVRSVSLIHGLNSSLPQAAKNQREISKRVEHWCAKADIVIPGFMGPDGFGRWDVLVPSPLIIDLKEWNISKRESMADGSNEIVKITHAPNFRGFKGSEFIIDAVEKLQKEGFKIELNLLEKLKNYEVKQILQEDTDILVEQIIFTGHALNGLEGMACGLPVLSNLEDESYTRHLRRWSYLDECPIVSSCPENLIENLRILITNPDLRREIGRASRLYVEKYQGFEAGQYMFGEVIKFLQGKRDSLINIYHPILGEYSIGKPIIEHPLKENKIKFSNS